MATCTITTTKPFTAVHEVYAAVDTRRLHTQDSTRFFIKTLIPAGTCTLQSSLTKAQGIANDGQTLGFSRGSTLLKANRCGDGKYNR